MQVLADGAKALGIILNARQQSAFELYYRELVDWNQRFNLTAITEERQVQLRHFLDSITCLTALTSCPPAPSGEARLRLLDIGTGAGFPGIPLKLVRPDWEVTLLEATAKKARFLEHVVAILGLKHVTCLQGRAEELAHEAEHRERYDVVVARAVANMPALAELMLPFCRRGGIIIAQKGGSPEAEVTSADYAIGVLGGTLCRVITLELPGLAEPRRLVVVRKTAPSPDKYPRRAGMPAKRPLLRL
jgi:16S rRNA (guanine527-N7)-methyltransferase